MNGLDAAVPTLDPTNVSYQSTTPTRPRVERAILYRPETGWTYSHHPYLTFFRGRYTAAWSNGFVDEDAPGQRVLFSTSRDFVHWTPPMPLVDSRHGIGAGEAVLTAAGFHEHAGQLTAYVGQYDDDRSHTSLFALTTSDGEQWGALQDLHLPIIPNQGPVQIHGGRLILAGNFMFPYTDDPSGLSGWNMTGLAPVELGEVSDNPASFWKISQMRGWPTALCEGSFFQTDDTILHMLLRSTGPHATGTLWQTTSGDSGLSWSEPCETAFTDNDTKFHFGRLPDGQFYYVGCPDVQPPGRRSPLILSLSADGVSFSRHFLLADDHYPMKKPGRWKNGEFGYPAILIHDGFLCVIVSRQKEGIEVLRVSLGYLTR